MEDTLTKTIELSPEEVVHVVRALTRDLSPTLQTLQDKTLLALIGKIDSTKYKIKRHG